MILTSKIIRLLAAIGKMTVCSRHIPFAVVIAPDSQKATLNPATFQVIEEFYFQTVTALVDSCYELQIFSSRMGWRAPVILRVS